MQEESKTLSERPLTEILRDERNQAAAGKNKEVSKKKPRWRDTELPTIERPLRARKAIERFGSGPEIESQKELQILKGSGMALKDIPNVAHKLAKVSRTEDILVLFHALLYGKRAKLNQLKSNILKFSGYVWGENKEKEQKKIKEKLERFTREGLYQLVDLLDLQVSKSSTKKEELIEEVFKFLLAPNITRKPTLHKPEQKSKKESLKVEETEDKQKKVTDKGQKKTLKGNGAAKMDREKVTPSEKTVAKDGGKSSVKRKKSQEEETMEVKKPSKRAKDSRDAGVLKDEQKDEVVIDETLPKEAKQRKEQKPNNTTIEGGRGDEVSEENVPVEDRSKEKKAGRTDSEVLKDESTEKENGEAIVERDLPEKVAPEDIKDLPLESVTSAEKDSNKFIDGTSVVSKNEEEHLRENGGYFQEKDGNAEEDSFPQDLKEECEGGVPVSEKVVAEPMEQPNNDITA